MTVIISDHWEGKKPTIEDAEYIAKYFGTDETVYIHELMEESTKGGEIHANGGDVLFIDETETETEVYKLTKRAYAVVYTLIGTCPK
jgi:hypothetical protein